MNTLKTQLEAVVLHRLVRWFCCNVAFVSWHKRWKGIYLHCLPRYCVRIFLWGVDWHRKNPLIHSPNNKMRDGERKTTANTTTELSDRHE